MYSTLFTAMGKKKPQLTAEFWKRDAEHRQLLRERIAYHEAKLKEARANPARP